jgi:hypothetical protein
MWRGHGEIAICFSYTTEHKAVARGPSVPPGVNKARRTEFARTCRVAISGITLSRKDEETREKRHDQISPSGRNHLNEYASSKSERVVH